MFLAAAATPSTTSVPTWLVVLLPILAALVSGSAGVAGALLGGRTARRTAERAAVLARQDEQRRWNRERREKAYVTLLERRNQLVELKRALAEGDDPHELGFSMNAINEETRQVFDAQESLAEALAVVELVGTAEAVELSRTWVQVLCSRRVKGDVEVLEDPLRTEEEDWCDPFVALIRKELSVDD